MSLTIFLLIFDTKFFHPSFSISDTFTANDSPFTANPICCAAAIATSSMITQLAKGKTLEGARKIAYKDVVKSLGGLPPIKVHCSHLAQEALKKAIEDYEERKEEKK